MGSAENAVSSMLKNSKANRRNRKRHPKTPRQSERQEKAFGELSHSPTSDSAVFEQWDLFAFWKSTLTLQGFAYRLGSSCFH